MRSEIIDGRYVILRKIGYGRFSTVWLALNLQDKKLNALKIQRSKIEYTDNALVEEQILHEVTSNFNNTKWINSVRRYLNDPSIEASHTHTYNL